MNVSAACDRVWAENRDEVTGTDTIGRRQQMITVNEPGLYQLIFQSRKPEAVSFQRWVFTGLLWLNVSVEDLFTESSRSRLPSERDFNTPRGMPNKPRLPASVVAQKSP
jgi:BRO family, N-terminal domain